jgi:hypothetical protein
MPINERGGNKTKKQKKSRKFETYTEVGDEQLFGKIVRNMGGHFIVLGTDNIERIGKLKTVVKRGPRIGKDAFVAFSLRSFNDKKECDIIGIAKPPQNIIKQFASIDSEINEVDIEFNYDSENEEFKNLDKIKVSNKNNDDYFNTDYLNNDSEENNLEEDEKSDNEDFEKYENKSKDLDFENLDFNKEIKENDIIDDNNFKENDKIDNNNFIENNKNKINIKKNNTEELNIENDINFDDINFDDI